MVLNFRVFQGDDFICSWKVTSHTCKKNVKVQRILYNTTSWTVCIKCLTSAYLTHREYVSLTNIEWGFTTQQLPVV